MNVRAESDARRGPGYAVFRLYGLTKAVDPSQVEITIRRAGGRNLGAGGWQVTDAKLTPEAVETADDGLSIFVGPEVVDHMEPLENYMLEVHAGSAELKSSFVWRNIAQSPLAAKRKTDEPAPDPEPMPTVVAAPEPEPGPEPEPDPDPEPEPEPGESYSPPTFQMDTAPQEDRGKGRIILIAAVALLLVLGALWYLFWDDIQDYFSDEPIIAEPVDEPVDEPIDEPVDDPGDIPLIDPLEPGDMPEVATVDLPDPVYEPTEQALDSLGRAREALSGDLTPEGALELGQEIYGAEDDADAAFLLIEFAADMGNPQAALMTGRFYDPTFEGPTGTIIPNPAMAIEWYQMAAAEGVSEADDDLNRLRGWVQDRADQGDREAIQLLESWQ